MRTMRSRSSNKVYWIVYLISPFIGACLAIRQFYRPERRKVILAYIIFFAFVMVMSREGMDGYRHAMSFMEASKDPIGTFLESFSGFLSFQFGTLDLYLHITQFLTGLVTDDPRWFFALNGLVFGSFYLGTLGLVYDEFDGTKTSLYSKLFLLIAALLIFVNHIHFVRFWTAAWLFLFCAYQVLVYGKRKYLWISILCILIHFSYVFAVGIFLTYYLISGTKFLVYTGMIVIFIIFQTYIGELLGLASGLGSGPQEKILNYTNQKYIEARTLAASETNWYVYWRWAAMKYFLYISFLYTLLSRRYRKDKVQDRLAGLAMLFAAVSLISLDVIGINRFSRLGLVLMAFFLFRNFKLNPTKRPSFILLLGTLVFIFFTVVEFRSSMDLLSPLHFIGNIVVIFFPQWDFVLRNII